MSFPAGKHYWFPSPFWAPQSGHSHVMPLHDMPQKFSSMHSWQMVNPQRQYQQKWLGRLQQLHCRCFLCRRFSL